MPQKASSAAIRTSPMVGMLPLLLRTAGLPAPVPEWRFAPPRRWRFDYSYPDLGIAIEVEGAIWAGGRHSRGGGYSADIEKYNESAIRGWMLIRLTYPMIESGEAIYIIRRAIEARRREREA